MDTIVIGIDGGEWDVIRPLLKQGELPNLAELKRNGCHGNLESITPPVSPPAWNSIQTGTNPGKHGIYDFSTFDDQYRRRSINSSDRRATPFWRILNDESVSTGLFKVPFTYPPGDVDGYVVTGFPTPDSVDDHAKPQSLTAEFETRLFEDWSLQHEGNYEAFKENLINIAKRQTEVQLDLVERFDTDFLMTVYDGSDRVQHFFWKYFDEDHSRYDPESKLADAIPEYYRTVDKGIGRILEKAGDDTNVVVISDHGFGPLECDIYVDEWLEENGFLTRYSEGSADQILSRTAGKLVEHSWNAIKQMELETTVKNLVPDDVFTRGQNLQDVNKRSIHWDETEAFFTTLSGQSIYVNLEDRFAEGAVPREEYENVVDRLVSNLLDLQDPNTGQRIIDEVHRSDDVFEGWAVKEAPDLIIESNPRYTLKDGRSDTLVQSSKQNTHERSGDHRSDGIIIASGPTFSQGQIEKASVTDIAPTLLYLHQCPIPHTMDGSVLTSLFAEDSSGKREIERTSKYGETERGTRKWTESEEEELEGQLKDMGYLG